MVYVYEQPEAQVIIMKCSSGFTVWLVKIIPYGWRQAGKNNKENALRVILDLLLTVISGINFSKCNGGKIYVVEKCPRRGGCLHPPQSLCHPEK